MPDTNGKAQRVLGTVGLMIGAGVILDAHAYWAGMPLLVVGAVVFVRGLLAAREHDAVRVDAGARAGIGEHIESRL